MKAKPLTIVLRIVAVLFSVALATVYVACQAGNGSEATDPQGDTSSQKEPIYFPSSKSRAFSPQSGTEPQGEPAETTPAEEDEPSVAPQFLPGSKSFMLFPASESKGRELISKEMPADEDVPSGDVRFLPGSKSDEISILRKKPAPTTPISETADAPDAPNQETSK